MTESSDGERSLWLLLPKPLRQLPADLAAIVVLVVLATLAATLPIISETPLRVVFGLPLVLFVPGYALVAALFPEAESSPTAEEADVSEQTDGDGINGIERVALSFGLSIAVVPLIGLVLNFTPWGIRLVPILIGVGGFTLVCTAIAARRRWDLPVDERFSVPYRIWLDSGYDELTAPETRVDGVLNVVLICSLLLAVGSVGYAVAVPAEGESFTEFYLLTENDDGELVAGEYPTELTIGNGADLVVGIGNHENEPVSYTVVVALQRVATDGNETKVRESSELTRFSPTVADNETWHQPHQVSPAITGTNLRLTYLLYKGEPTDQRDLDSAYRSNYIWVNVTSE